MITMEKQDKDITNTMDNKWEFNEEVTNCFEEMLDRSIPNYKHMRELITNVGVNHIQSYSLYHTNILDIGSSQGRQIELLADKLYSNNFFGIEISEPMVKYSRKKFQKNLNVQILKEDVTKKELPCTQCGLITAILTIQFIPIEYRQKLLTNIYNSLHRNGLFIFVEKVIGDNYDFSQLYEDLYYNMKMQNGYTLQEIREKRLKLEGVLVPVTNEFNINLLKQAGFKKIEIFWKDLNFIGYLAMK